MARARHACVEFVEKMKLLTTKRQKKRPIGPVNSGYGLEEKQALSYLHSSCLPSLHLDAQELLTTSRLYKEKQTKISRETNTEGPILHLLESFLHSYTVVVK